MSISPSLSRRRFLLSGALGAAAAAMSSLPIRTFADGEQLPAPIATVSATPSQTMQGFGAAGAWWPNDLVKFAPAVRERVADLLFGRDGIELSVYRYNIGGGGVAIKNPVRAPESFFVAPGVYDWDRDPGGRLFLRMAAERGVPILIGFVNTAPSIWTSNDASCGGTLREGAEAAFAKYLVDVVEHFRQVDGVKLSYLSPMNEPDYTFDSCGQEGMSVPPEQRAALVQAVGGELAARAAYCRVIADESSKTGEHFMREVSRWLGTLGTADYVAALAVHRYDYPNDLVLDLARDQAERQGLPLWSTEICCFDSRTGSWGQQYDPTITSALMMANFIWQGISVANDAAFHWWVALSSELGSDPAANPDAVEQPNPDGWNDGLLYYDPHYAQNGNQQIYLTKRFFALGNFSRYVRPGDQRYDISGTPRNLHVLAFASGATRAQPPVQLPGSRGGASRSWKIIVINNGRAGSDPTNVRIQLPAADRGRFSPDVAVETSDRRNLETVALPSISASGLFEASVPSQSITTYVLGSE